MEDDGTSMIDEANPTDDGAKAAVVVQHEQRSLQTITEKTKALMEILRQPAEALAPEERRKQALALAEEITNIILELPEPHRSALAKLYTPMWEKLRG